MEPLTPLPTAEPELLNDDQLAVLYEDLAPKCETPFKARVRAELERRLWTRVFLDGRAYRFATDDRGDLVKFPKPTTVSLNALLGRSHRPALRGRDPRPCAARAAKRSGGIAAHKLYNAEDDGY